MSKSFGMKIHFGDLKRFQKKFEDEFGKNMDCGQYIKEILNTSASRCIKRTADKTPVDTGQLRKNWSAKPAVKAGFDYRVTIENPVEYATYVEFGHRPNWKGIVKGMPNKGRLTFEELDDGKKKWWVEGYFMLTKSIDETRKDLPEVAEEVLIKKFLELTK